MPEVGGGVIVSTSQTSEIRVGTSTNNSELLNTTKNATASTTVLTNTGTTLIADYTKGANYG